MRAMTPEEFQEADTKDSYWRYNYTHLPPTLTKMFRTHCQTASRILHWLESIGCKTSYWYDTKDGVEATTKRLLENTRLNIKIRHDNDYIECGPATDDREGQMFHVITTFCVEATFEPEDTLAVSQQLDLFADKKLEINKELTNVNFDFYSWSRKLKTDSSNSSTKWGIKLAYDLEFEIKHTWGSTAEKE